MNDRSVRLSDGAALSAWQFGYLETVAGVPNIPASGTLSLLNGTTVLAADGVVTVAADGSISYAWGAGDIAALNTGTDPVLDIRGLWTFSDGTERVRYVDIVNVDVDTRIRSADIVAAKPELKTGANKFTSAADSGTTTQLTDGGSLSTQRPNELVGGTVRMISGNNAGDVRIISASDPVAGTIDVSKAWQNSTSGGNRYEITTAWAWQIREALILIQQKVDQWVGRKSGAAIATGQDIREAHLNLSIAYALKSAPIEPTVKMEYAQYAKDAETALMRAKVHYTVGAAKDLDISSRVVFSV